MKKLIAAALATLLVTGAVAPAFAYTQTANCVFKDKAMCEVRSLLDD